MGFLSNLSTNFKILGIKRVKLKLKTGILINFHHLNELKKPLPIFFPGNFKINPELHLVIFIMFINCPGFLCSKSCI